MKKIIRNRVIALIAAFLMLFSSCSMVFNVRTVYAETNASIAQEIGKEYSGFRLDSVKNVPEIDSDVMIFKHIKTGARLMYVKNDDTQRVFSISFRTPASDDTGTNHIIEHSVLDGSKNYPVKSPFKEMLKGSLGSFINAFTTTDYTLFPVASTNEQDLKNLMGIYLDSVFYPNVTQDPDIFKQEGWRYELPSKDSELKINGVVYNEMKGNYSNPAYILQKAANQSLFPDTSRKWDAGGDPNVIPTLTRGKLISTYKKNYTPSNSYMFLYGKLDISKYLDFIDKNYLSKMDNKASDTSVKVQKNLSNIPVKTAYYSVDQNGETKKKSYLSLNFVTGNIGDKEANIGLSFLSYLLCGTENAPLKKALKDAKIAEDVNCSFSMQSNQPVFTINAVNADESSKEVFKKTIYDTLEKISKDGFDEDYLKSALSAYDISDRISKLTGSTLKGILLSVTALSTWIYDEDPTMYFETDSVMKKIKNSDENKYFKDLIGKYLLSNKFNSLVVLNPKAGLESKNVQDAAKKLSDYKNKIGANGVLKLVKETQEFNAWQKSGDSKEALAAIPKLSLKDIKPELPDLRYSVEDKYGMKILTHKADLKGLSSINLYFDTSKVPQDKLHYLALLSSVLGNTATNKYSSLELSNEMQKYTGGQISFSASEVANIKNADIYSPKMTVSFLTPDDNISKCFDLIKEIIKSSKLDNKDEIKQIIEQDKSTIGMLLSSGSGSLALMRMNSYMSESGKYNEELSGITYYEFLKDLDDNFDAKWNDIAKNLKDTCALAFNGNGLVASQSGNENGAGIFKSELGRMSTEITRQNLPSEKYVFTQPDKNTAFSSSAKVQTIIQGGNMNKAGYKYSGKMMVLQNILDTGYLWNKVRTAGGAYGVQSSISPNGEVFLISMRDPNLSETLESFNGAVNYLKNFKATDDEMENYIIGAIKSFVNMKNGGAVMEGSICDSMYLKGLSYDDLIKYENEALSTSEEDIRSYGDMLDKIIKQNTYFVEGSKEKIEQNKKTFNNIVDTQK